MSLAEEPAPTALGAGSQVGGANRARSIRDTSLYSASLGLFGVLTGLALITPLNAFANDVLDDPVGGNWSARFMVIGLLAMTGFWLHYLTANMGGKILAGGSSERHPTLPGIRWFTGYHTALTDMWWGAVLVVLLIILAAAIPRGITTFLAAYVAFLGWIVIVDGVYFARNRTWARLVWRNALRPLAVLRQMASDRFIPAYPDDVDTLTRGDNPDVEQMYVRSGAIEIWDSLIFAAASIVLWLIASSSPGLSATVSCVWLVSVVVRIALWYRLFPQLYAT